MGEATNCRKENKDPKNPEKKKTKNPHKPSEKRWISVYGKRTRNPLYEGNTSEENGIPFGRCADKSPKVLDSSIDLMVESVRTVVRFIVV